MLQATKIAIIGAGIAGLSCATSLQKAGFSVTLFEKSRGTSGRLSTRETPHWQCDHGAQYFTARDAHFAAEVERWVKAGVAQLWQPNLQVYDGKSFTAKEANLASQTQRYVGYPKNNAPAKWLANSLNVHTETTVIGINQHAQQWQIYSKEHGVHAHHFGAVLLAIPAPQAAALLANVATSASQISASVVMQPCFALMLKLKSILPCEFDGLFINHGPLSWVARDSAKPGRSNQANTSSETWILHATSQWSNAHVNDDKEAVSDLMLDEFMSILQRSNALQHSMNVESKQLHRWLYADCEQYLSSVYHYDKANNIGLCGDWLNGGKVQGAWLSGFKLAQHIIDENKQ